MNNYYEHFQELRKQLESNPLIEIDHFEMEEGLSNANILMIEEEFKIIVPESIKMLYREVSSVDFLWLLKDGADVPLLDNDSFGSVNGKAYIPDLYTVFDGIGNSTGKDAWKNFFWFPDSMDNETIEENKKVRPIDFFDNNNGECVCVLKEESKFIKDDLYLRYEDGEILPLDLTIDTYIDLLTTTFGFVNFQSAYMSRKSYENKKMKYYLPRIFPAISLKEFE
jgi:hypothetical protein